MQVAGNPPGMYVIVNASNAPVDPHTLNRALARDIARAQVRPINVHGLRHSMATAAVSAGVSMRVLQDLLGHASLSTTAQIYAHVVPAERVSAVAAVSRAVL